MFMDADGWDADWRTTGGDDAAHNPVAHHNRTDSMGTRRFDYRNR